MDDEGSQRQKLIAEAMAEIRAELEAGLDGRFSSMRALLVALREGQGDARLLLRREAHRLKGAAGSCGLRALGASAGELEEAVRAGASLDEIELSLARLERAREG